MAKNKKMSTTKRLEALNDKIQSWFDYYSDNINQYLHNVSFVMGDQWDPDTISYYAANNKAIITYNILNKNVTQIVGEQLKTTPEMQIVVDTDMANQKKIALRQDLLRTIQIKNNSKECYETAFECALTGGFGALHFYNDYEEGLSFNQEVKQDVVKEPALCFWDPKAKDKTKGDGDYAGIINFMRKKDFERKYPNAMPCSENWNTQILDPGYFVTEEDEDELIAVADMYEKRYTKKTIVMVSPTMSGEKFDVILKKDFEDYVARYVDGVGQVNMLLGLNNPVQAPQITDERIVDDYKIKCYRLTKNEILETYDFPSRYLPVIYVDGYSYSDSGKQIVKSFTQEAHDAQKTLNYFYSELAQSVRTYRRETIYGTNKMFNGSSQQMANPEKPSWMVPIVPDPLMPNGPIFRESRPLPPELLQACEAAKMAVLDILGRSEAAMGEQGNESSGVAIQQRVQQQNTRINKFRDGLIKALEQAGKLTNDLISNLYDQPREMLLYKEDNKGYNAKLNNFNKQMGDVDNEITNEDFAIRISVGNNYELQRQQNRQYILDMMAASQNPMFSKVGDLLARLSDCEVMPQLVERIKTMVDPAILAKEEGKPPPPPPPPPPQLMLEQQKLQNEMALTQVKAQQSEIDKMKAQVQLMLGVMGLQEKGIQADAEVKRAEVEFGKQLSQDHLDHVGHGVQALGHLKDLAAMVQQPASQGASIPGQT